MSKSKQLVVHMETYSFGHWKIDVKCSCPLGRDHTHEECRNIGESPA